LRAIRAFLRRLVAEDFLELRQPGNRLAGGEVGNEPAPERRAAHGRRPFHNDEAGSLQILHESLGDDARHYLAAVANLLSAASGETHRELSPQSPEPYNLHRIVVAFYLRYSLFWFKDNFPSLF
jgi:hypothetical protein